MTVGQKAWATNVSTGLTSLEPVTLLLLRHDTDRYNLIVRVGHRTAVIDTTRRHLFFDLTQNRWVKASALKHGDHLRGPSGHIAATVTGGYTPRDRDGWMWDLAIPGNGDHDFYVRVLGTAVLMHNCPASAKKPWRPWQLTRQGASAVKRGGPFNTTFFKSASDGTWWTVDTAEHGGSAFKVFEETGSSLSWIHDADEFGNYIAGKWKGQVGRFIPWSSLYG